MGHTNASKHPNTCATSKTPKHLFFGTVHLTSHDRKELLRKACPISTTAESELQQRRCESTSCGASQNGAPSQPQDGRFRPGLGLCPKRQKPSCLQTTVPQSPRQEPPDGIGCEAPRALGTFSPANAWQRPQLHPHPPLWGVVNRQNAEATPVLCPQQASPRQRGAGHRRGSPSVTDLEGLVRPNQSRGALRSPRLCPLPHGRFWPRRSQLRNPASPEPQLWHMQRGGGKGVDGRPHLLMCTEEEGQTQATKQENPKQVGIDTIQEVGRRGALCERNIARSLSVSRATRELLNCRSTGLRAATLLGTPLVQNRPAQVLGGANRGQDLPWGKTYQTRR